jgi:hypothetical protein
MHMALNAWMADFEGLYKQTPLGGGPMFGSRRDKQTGVSRRQRAKDLLMTKDIDAKLPDRPSLEGYRVDVLSLDQVVHLFRSSAKHRA